jgi:hypothetical protein
MSPVMAKGATTPEPSLGQSERDAEEAAQLDQLAEEVTGGDKTAGKKGKAAVRVSCCCGACCRLLGPTSTRCCC